MESLQAGTFAGCIMRLGNQNRALSTTDPLPLSCIEGLDHLGHAHGMTESLLSSRSDGLNGLCDLFVSLGSLVELRRLRTRRLFIQQGIAFYDSSRVRMCTQIGIWIGGEGRVKVPFIQVSSYRRGGWRLRHISG